MPHTPEIAILEQNTLAALGLRTILEELIPNAVVLVFRTTDRRHARHVCPLLRVGTNLLHAYRILP